MILDLPRKVESQRTEQTAPYVSDIFAQYSVIHPRRKDGKKKRRRRNPETGELENRDEPPIPESSAAQGNEDGEQDEPADVQNDDEPSAGFEESVEEPAKIQIVGLHRDSPIISYKGNFYSCKWASSIGSDLVFARKPEDPDSDRNCLYSLPSWDLLDTGSARLIASNAQIDRRTTADNFSVSARSGEVENAIDDVSNPAVRQTSFLTRLREIQVRRGEVDPNVARGTIETPRRGRRGRRARRGTPSSTDAGRAEAQRFSLSTPTPATWDAVDTTGT